MNHAGWTKIPVEVRINNYVSIAGSTKYSNNQIKNLKCLFLFFVVKRSFFYSPPCYVWSTLTSVTMRKKFQGCAKLRVFQKKPRSLGK